MEEHPHEPVLPQFRAAEGQQKQPSKHVSQQCTLLTEAHPPPPPELSKKREAQTRQVKYHTG